MVEYGYINERGCLTSRMLEQQIERYKDDCSGEVRERIITIEKQARELELQGWKIVDIIDESKMVTDEYYSIYLTPYDSGDRISYQYEKVFDKKAVSDEVRKLKRRLSSTESDIGDYKITKCYEASLSDEPLPYDIKTLREERQKVRNRINELEEIIINNK
mgnify:CR=1 FL=1